MKINVKLNDATPTFSYSEEDLVTTAPNGVYVDDSQVTPVIAIVDRNTPRYDDVVLISGSNIVTGESVRKDPCKEPNWKRLPEGHTVTVTFSN